MKKVIGKNQVIITSLAILIAVAGYLNFADVDLGFRDKEASTDSSSILEDAGYDLTDETALLDENQADGGLTDNSLTDSQETDTPGEAVFTGSTGFAAQAKISREQVRSQNKADLQDIINNEEIDDEEKQEAIHTMVSMTDLSEKEAAAELLLEAKVSTLFQPVAAMEGTVEARVITPRKPAKSIAFRCFRLIIITLLLKSYTFPIKSASVIRGIKSFLSQHHFDAVISICNNNVSLSIAYLP